MSNKLLFRIGTEDNYLSVYPHKVVRVWGKKRHTMPYDGTVALQAPTSEDHYSWVIFNLTDTQWGYRLEKYTRDYVAVGFCPRYKSLSVSYTANKNGKTLNIPQVWQYEVSDEFMKSILEFSKRGVK